MSSESWRHEHDDETLRSVRGDVDAVLTQDQVDRVTTFSHIVPKVIREAAEQLGLEVVQTVLLSRVELPGVPDQGGIMSLEPPHPESGAAMMIEALEQLESVLPGGLASFGIHMHVERGEDDNGGAT